MRLRTCIILALAAHLVAAARPLVAQRAAAPGAATSGHPAARPFAAETPWARSARNANYTIDVRLDSSQRTLKGKEVIFWRNMTRAQTSELQFHVYWNA